jgi:hypothetical protein
MKGGEDVKSNRTKRSNEMEKEKTLQILIGVSYFFRFSTCD